MKSMRWGLIALGAAVLLLGLGATAYAFHSGGVAECVGCHSMHDPKPGGRSLLIGTDPSSTCLSCHERAGDTGPSSYHISTASSDLPAGTAPKQRTPGGDFGWLRKSYIFVVRGSTTVEDGAEFGHNIVAVDKGYFAVSGNAPGGTFPASQLSCTSCHDPHGKYRRLSTGQIATAGGAIKASGSYTNATTNEPDATNPVGVYRLLAGVGYTNSTSGSIPFPGNPPAKVPSSYNMSEASNQVRVAYGHSDTTNGHTSWGKWCATCHGDMHSDGHYVHPVDQQLSSDIIGRYNRYKKSGDNTGDVTTAFSSLAPFATGSSNYATLAGLATTANTSAGPAGGDRVICLSCHRAHATGFPFMLRWQVEGEFMMYDGKYPGTDTTPTVPQFSRGRTGAEQKAAYYDRPETYFANYQRLYCNKCHAKD